jgi:hypothetical protein
MKRSGEQFPTCDSCGREIKGAATRVSTRGGGMMAFHPDAHGCANAPEHKERSERAKKNN